MNTKETKTKIIIWQIIGFAVSCGLGTLLHFLYDITQSEVVAIFAAVNESTWEHMKLLFFSTLIFAIIEKTFIDKGLENFFCVKLKGILLGLLLIPALFYTINGVFGKTPDFVNIALFFVSVAATFFLETKILINSSRYKNCHEKLCIFILCVIAVLFGLFTFLPPDIPLFLDPVTNMYGIV